MKKKKLRIQNSKHGIAEDDTKAKDANSQVYWIVNPEKYRWFQEIAEEVILFHNFRDVM